MTFSRIPNFTQAARFPNEDKIEDDERSPILLAFRKV